MKKKYTLKIFCDFDGTVTKKDVWVDALGKFIKDDGKFADVCKDFEEGRITSRECIRRELALVEDFDFDVFNEYIDTQELDDHFYEFIDFCKENNFEIILLSEGLDYYIKYVQKKFNLNLKFFANELEVITQETNGKKSVRITCNFPYSDEHCNCCGMSKRNVLISNTNDLENEVSVFIGDGVSDFCASNYADIVFAKKSLASYCWKNNITYYDFSDFADVKNKLIKIIEKGQVKHKQNAKNLRKDVLLGG
ncbi:MAG: HAD-IB family phosphatase [Ignavibacteria bacterium]|nr:HAD-IB family phosphatase [Ignavibacteria bacterium]